MAKQMFRMSSSGYCPKRLSAMLIGAPSSEVPKWLAASAEEGNWHEARIKQEMAELGCEVIDDQRELELDCGDFYMVGHIDGRIRISGKLLDSPLFNITFVDVRRADLDFSKYYLLEVKSMSYLEFQRWRSGQFDAFPWYAAQSTCYEKALDEDTMVYAVKDRSNGTRNLYIVKGARASMPEIEEKLRTVAQFVAQGQLAPAELDLDSIECRRFCAFRQELCSPNKATVDDPELEQAARDYKVGREMESTGKAIAAAAKETLVEFALEKKLNNWQSGPYSVNYSHYTRESISISGLSAIMDREEFGPAITESEIDRIRVIDTSKED